MISSAGVCMLMHGVDLAARVALQCRANLSLGTLSAGTRCPRLATSQFPLLINDQDAPAVACTYSH